MFASDEDRFHEECGVVGVFGHPEAANLAYLALYALQHRGQESAGIVSSRGDALISHRGLGLVADIFHPEMIRRLEGTSAIGHNRYATHGETVLKNAQPLVVEYAGGPLAVAHNGNLVNAVELRAELERRGSIFQSNSDTEVVIHLIAQSEKGPLLDRVVDALKHVRGAYSIVFLARDQLIAVRDPYGFRPLVLGRIRDKGTYVVVSETCALDLINAEYVREVEPGEVIVIDDSGMRSMKPLEVVEPRRCVFEYVYFARPDSQVFGRTVYNVRRELGRQLARESLVDADVVTPVPDSGVPAALGYAQQSGIPYELGLIRNHYVGRTFIEPSDSIRHFGVRVKLNAVSEVLRGKRVVVVDDSLVRGTTSKKIVTMMRNAGAAEVHMRICSPPTIRPCYYGVDTPTTSELVGASKSVEEIRQAIGADTLSYLSDEGLYAFEDQPENKSTYCDACFTNRYPVAVDESAETRQLGLFDAAAIRTP
ncbi:MAG: amidophosphoribosyltransferase [Candidatus Binatia bacterium]|nr:amidophosphoribosyltransferase [Candidatus Binatia bacterium]MDG2010835.1 amidophosphoribosyltransferase [Candidatus Binatia bacterium]